MKKIIVLISLIGMFMMDDAEAAKITISDDLVNSICQVESRNNPNAVGDNGKSVGIAQIQKICVDDVNRILKLQKKSKRFTYDDRKNVEKSKEMMKIYLSFYGRLYEKETGLKVTPKILARIWNGGPKGYKVKATYAYYQKVRKYLMA